MTTLSVIVPTEITDAMLVSSTVAETEYSAWSGATTYADADRVIYNHRIYESTGATNLNHNPETDITVPPWWVDLGPTNRWACMDQQTSTVTTSASAITMVFEPGRFSSFAVIGVDATSIYLKVDSTVDGIVYEQMHDLTDSSLLPDWYAYFYDRIRKPRELTLDITSIPALGDVTVTVTVSNSGGDVAIGGIIFGWLYTLGEVKHGARAGIIDYSRKETDDFGVTTFVKRSYSKRMSLALTIEADQVDYVHMILSELRATPCLWRGASGIYTVLTVFGFYLDFEIDIAYPNFSDATLTIEGMT